MRIMKETEIFTLTIKCLSVLDSPEHAPLLFSRKRCVLQFGTGETRMFDPLSGHPC